MNRTKNTLITISLFLLFSLSGFFSYGQGIKLKAEIERDTIWLGDQIHLSILAEQPVGTKLEFPQVPDSISGKIEVVSKSVIDTTKIDANNIRLKQTYVITCFDSGPHFVPPFRFKVQSGIQNDTLKTNGLNLFVKFPEVDLKKGPADIKKPFAAPVIFKEIAPWVLGGILILALIFLIIYAISRYRKNKPLFMRPEKPKLPPHVIALQELEQLKEAQLWQHDKVKDYYTRLTDIIRNYIEDRFALPAMEQTTYEILSAFTQRKNMIDEISTKDLKEILELADLVKFAKLTPLPDDNHASMNHAYQFVDHTKIEEKQEPAKEEEKQEELLDELSGKEGKNRP
jgi:hypothetical protein